MVDGGTDPGSEEGMADGSPERDDTGGLPMAAQRGMTQEGSPMAVQKAMTQEGLPMARSCPPGREHVGAADRQAASAHSTRCNHGPPKMAASRGPGCGLARGRAAFSV